MDKLIKGSPLRHRMRRAPSELKFFDEQQYQVAPAHPNDVDIWVEAAKLYVRLTRRWRTGVTAAANRFQAFRGPAQDATMVLEYHNKYVADILVVSRKKLTEHKGNRIAIHDGQRDIFVLLPADFSQRILGEAMNERKARTVWEDQPSL